MATKIGSHFAGIVALARVKLAQVEVNEDINPDRAILFVQGRFGPYRVVIKEVITPQRRRYAYYLFSGDRVVLAFDNHADRQALRLKYGADFVAHLAELIPHRHRLDKTMMELTESWTAERFLTELESLTAGLGHSV